MKAHKRITEMTHHILNIEDEDYWRGWSYEYEDEECQSCHRYFCECTTVLYDIIPDDENVTEIISDIFGGKPVNVYKPLPIGIKGNRIRYASIMPLKNYRRIDMMSIYSKEIMRGIKIDMILNSEDTSNTIENIINAK